MKQSKIKILFLDHAPFVGGAQLSLIQHLEKIDREKFDIIIGCSVKAKELGLTDQYETLNIRYYFISFGHLKSFNLFVLFRLLKSVIEVRKIVKKEDIKLVFGNTVRTDIIGSLAALLLRVKIVWFIQDYTFPKFLFNFLKFIPEKILYVSKSIANYYSVQINNKNKVIYIWRNFYKRIAKITKEQIQLKRQEWGADDNTVVIGYIGRLVHWKGPQILIKAVDILAKQEIKNIKCVIIGSGKGQETNNEQDLKDIVKSKKLEDYIIFTGHQKDIPLCMSVLDIFCLTSIEPEPFSSVVIEAMMAKVPVIGTNIGGTPEIVKNEKTGLLVEPNNAYELSKSIKKLIDKELLKKEITQRAYNHVMKYNTGELITKKLENIYEQIV
ncbi:MAG: glycosyltransferase family 4 protein [Patescibacteria group bacterium]|nr:glycosyltransferase family 4 protein [Patescibacteria group bacterium]